MSFENYQDQNLNVVEKMPLRLMISPIVGGGVILSAWLLAIPAGMVMDSVSANAAEDRALESIGGTARFDDAVDARRAILERAASEGIDSRIPDGETLASAFDELTVQLIDATTREVRGNKSSYGQGSTDYQNQIQRRYEQAQQRTLALESEIEKAALLNEYIEHYNGELDNVTADKLAFLSFEADDALTITLNEHFDSYLNDNNDGYVLKGVPFTLEFERQCENGETVSSSQTLQRTDDLTDDLSDLLNGRC